MEISTREHGTGKVYKGNIRPAIAVIIGILLIHGVVLMIFWTEINAIFWIMNALALLAYALIFSVMYFQATQIAITVYEDGIDWQRGSSHVFTTWENINYIGRNDEGDSTTYGIFLHKEVQAEAHSWIDKRFFSAPVTYIRLIPTVKVPTKWDGLRQGSIIDMEAFAGTEFGQNLLQYAPHLLEQDKS